LSARAPPQRPCWRSLQRSPRPLSWILGDLLLRGRGRDVRGREGKRGEGKRGEGRRKGKRRDGEGKEAGSAPQAKAWPL